MKNNWQRKRLGEVCDIYQPKTISKKEMVVNGKYLVFGANGIIGKYNKYNHENSELLITCRGATCGSVNISIPKSWINGNAMVIKPLDKKQLLKDFLRYFFIGIDLSNVVTGSAQPQITRQTLAPFPIYIPPLPEQRRIVKILDEVFKKMAKAKENAEKNLQNAKEFFKSYSQNIFASPGKDWEEKKIGEVCAIVNGGTPDTNVLKYWGGNNLWITPKDMGKLDDIYVNDTTRKISNFGLKNSSAKLLPVDSVILSSRAPIGYLAINKKEMATNQGCKGLIPNNNLKTLYLFYFLKNSIKLLNSLGSGTTFKELSGTKLSEVVILLPKLLGQKTIVKKLDILSIKTKKLEEIYKQKLLDLEELKKSILKKALVVDDRNLNL